MDELIRKKDAIDAMLGDKVEITNVIRAIGIERDFEVLNTTCDRHAEIIKALPPVQPQRMKGAWINEGRIIRCNKCKIGYAAVKGMKSALTYNFCPNCGADMREVRKDGTD